MLLSEVANVADGLNGINRAPAPVMGILQADQPGWGMVGVFAAADLRGDLLSGDDPALTMDLIDLHPGKGRDATGFGAKGMVALLHDNFVTRLGLGLDAELVGHGAGRDEESCFKAQQIGGHLLQVIDRRVFAKNVVAHFRIGHGQAHGLGRLCNGITTQIDHGDYTPWPCHAPLNTSTAGPVI